MSRAVDQLPTYFADAREALWCLEGVRGLEALRQWTDRLRSSNLLGEDGLTHQVLPYYGRLGEDDPPPCAVSLGTPGRHEDAPELWRLPSGETVYWEREPEHGGGWKLCR